MISWQLVRGRIAFMARGKSKEGPESPVPEAKTPEVQGPKKEPELSRAATTVNPLQRRIIELDRQKLTPRAISDALEEEGGEVVSNSEIMDVIVKHAKGWFHESPS